LLPKASKQTTIEVVVYVPGFVQLVSGREYGMRQVAQLHSIVMKGFCQGQGGGGLQSPAKTGVIVRTN